MFSSLLQYWTVFTQGECFYHLKTLIHRAYFFYRNNQFSRGYFMQDTQDSNLDCILLATTCDSLLQQYRPVLPNVNVFPSFECRYKEYSFTENISYQREILCRTLKILIKMIFCSSYMCPFNAQNRPTFHAVNAAAHSNADR
jgi:hypothetical protein